VLSGFARNPIERLTAESVAMKVRGVKSVQNNVAVQP
jgi:osmotically-inducible protein OsmY